MKTTRKIIAFFKKTAYIFLYLCQIDIDMFMCMRKNWTKFAYRVLGGLCFFLWSLFSVQANNVQLVGDITISDPISEVSIVSFTLEWDNSWKDDYNYDAVYFFLKYKRKTGEWQHMYLVDDGYSVGHGYGLELVNSSGQSGKNEGVFIHRSVKGNGRSTVSVKLKWNIKSNPLDPVIKGDIIEGTLLTAGTGIEMVYIPRGPFYVGDNKYSQKSLQTKGVEFPIAHDILNSNYATRSVEPIIPAYPAINAINRVNDITTSYSNAWVGGGNTSQYWRVDFYTDQDGHLISGAKTKKITYLAISSIPGHVPKTWELQGANSLVGGAWEELFKGTNADWDTTLLQAYPPRKILKIINPQPFRYYRIMIYSMGSEGVPVIKSIAMTDVDLESTLDYSTLIDQPTTSLGGEYGMHVIDADTWSGETDINYPNGYKGFYVMKYEIGQEQFVEFLNKLPYTAQKNHTIGSSLDHLEIGSYLFSSQKTESACRNGIMLQVREEVEGVPVIFGCNYTKEAPYSTSDDGQAIACNYLSINNMLAYADWAGLRPLTEMEYEKMSKQPYPIRPEKGEFAWDSNTGLVKPSGLSDEGTKMERVLRGNVNAQRVFKGPLRCGIFANEGSKQSKSGSSFWGVMELSGNLSEMYYSINTAGRTFRGGASHGNGILDANGYADVSAWDSEKVHEAIVARGGSFQSGETSLAVASRDMAYKYFRDENQRDSTMTFRLGYTASEKSVTNILTSEDGRTTITDIVFDTICSGMDYKIIGNEIEGEPYFTYLWYRSENEGKTWTLLEDEKGQDLYARKLVNIGMEEGESRVYYFKRKLLMPHGGQMSHPISIRVIDDSYRLDRLLDTVTVFDEAKGIRVWTKNDTKFTWRSMGTDKLVTPTVENERYSHLMPRRSMFIEENDKSLYGTKIVELKINVLGVCLHNETIELMFPDAADMNVIGIVKEEGVEGARRWSDGRIARSADEYRNPHKYYKSTSDPLGGDFSYRYVGQTGNGIYWVDSDGGGPAVAFKVYCDMETDESGWMLAGKFSNNDRRTWCANKSYWTSTSGSYGTFGSAIDATTYADAKTKAWTSCKVDYMMFQTMGVSAKSFSTFRETFQDIYKTEEKMTLSEFFTRALNGFPNTGRTDCNLTLEVQFLNSRYGDFSWINTDGFQAGVISIGKYDGGDTQGVISGYSCGAGEADHGLGSLEDPSFADGGSRSDVGSGGAGASNANNVLLFVR